MRTAEEREDKFEVPADWQLPDLGAPMAPVTERLVNEYHDTPDGRLAASGLTLRRRTSDTQAVWQLKLPSGSHRTEVTVDEPGEAVPAELTRLLSGLTGTQPLRPVAEVVTERHAHRVTDAGGQLVAEVADDHVSATAYGDVAVLQRWREVEVELGPRAQDADAKRLRTRLTKAGARPSRHRSKLQRALGATPPRPGEARKPKRLGALVGAYLAEQSDELLVDDVRLRLGDDVVHRTRVAVRRFRSTLRTFADLVDADEAGALDAELTWYAGLLGAVRDCDVLAAHLTARVAALPEQHVLGPVARRIAETIALERKDAVEALADAMASPRYLELTEALHRWRSRPPLTPAARAKAAAAGDYVRRARRKADRKLRRAGGEVEALHRARKAAKRARYAADLAASVVPKAAGLAKQAKRRQTVLGEHQDALVAAAFLHRLGAAAGVEEGHNGFTYGLLMADELHRAAEIRASLRR